MNKPIICGEIGINHSGSLDTALELIDMIHSTSADVAKFQKRSPRESVPRFEWPRMKETPWGTVEPYIEYKEKLEFGKREYDEIDRYCKQLGIPFTASVWDIPSLEFITQYDIPFLKIPSAHLTNLSLLMESIKTGIPIVASTGMSTLEEIDKAVSLFPEDYDLTILHCHSVYPQPQEETNLKAIQTLRERYNRPIGYSSHDTSPFSSIMAMWRYDACFIEVHCALSRADPGSDMAASLEKEGLELITREKKRMKIIDGDGIIRLWDSEKKSRKHLRGK